MMRRSFSSLITILFLTFVAAGQDAKPQPTPPDDVVKITTNLIQVDVSVTDSKGKIVTDLKPNEIEIYENGEKQKITNFSFISSVREQVKKPAEIDKNAPPLPPTTVQAENVRRTIALVVDDLSLSFESAYYTRHALKKFVDEQMQDGDLVAIIRTGAGIGALQQFTTDKRMLYAAIERVKWNPIGTGGIGAFAPIEARVPEAGEPSEPEPGARTPEGQEREFDDFRSSFFASGTLGAVNYVINGMSELPGRKSIIFFSDGFQLLNTDAQGFTGPSSIMNALRRLIDNANRAAVVIYSIDPRGLVYTGLTAADNTAGSSFEQIESQLSDRRTKLFDTQQALQLLSRETGGFALINNNDLSGGVRRVLEDQSYYLVGYEPDDDTFDPVKRRFNKLEVKVLRPGLKVRYRSGFFNIADREKPANTTVAGKTPIQQLQNALVSPFAVNGITLRLNAIFGSTEKNEAFVRSLLHIDAKNLTFTDEPNGEKKVVFDVLAVSFGDNGQVVDQLGKSYTMISKTEAYKRMMKQGFVYHFMFPVKKAGAYQYRVAIRDSQGNKVGSASQFIEVPNLKKKRLTLSSIVMDALTPDEWAKDQAGQAYEKLTDPMTDTAIRRVSTGSVFHYGFEIYNAKLDAAKLPKINTRVRVFRDGKMILDGKQTPLDLRGQTDFAHLKSTGAISIGSQMLPGDYILQIIVTDEIADKKKQIATQFIQFEVVE
jgi:VWFA-related protein